MRSLYGRQGPRGHHHHQHQTAFRRGFSKTDRGLGPDGQGAAVVNPDRTCPSRGMEAITKVTIDDKSYSPPARSRHINQKRHRGVRAEGNAGGHRTRVLSDSRGRQPKTRADSRPRVLRIINSPPPRRSPTARQGGEQEPKVLIYDLAAPSTSQYSDRRRRVQVLSTKAILTLAATTSIRG